MKDLFRGKNMGIDIENLYRMVVLAKKRFSLEEVILEILRSSRNVPKSILIYVSLLYEYLNT